MRAFAHGAAVNISAGTRWTTAAAGPVQVRSAENVRLSHRMIAITESEQPLKSQRTCAAATAATQWMRGERVHNDGLKEFIIYHSIKQLGGVVSVLLADQLSGFEIFLHRNDSCEMCIRLQLVESRPEPLRLTDEQRIAPDGQWRHWLKLSLQQCGQWRHATAAVNEPVKEFGCVF